MRNSLKVLVWSAAITAGGAGGIACASSNTAEEQAGETGMSVQYGYVGNPGTSGNGTYGLELVKAGTSSPLRQRAVGTLRTTFGSTRYSCGLTFVTQHNAITAAHCLTDANDAPLPAGSVVTVQQVDTSNYDLNQRFSNSRVKGTWNGTGYSFNDYVHFDQPNSGDGYVPTTYTCTTLSFCGGSASQIYNCPGSLQGVDLGAVRCSNRNVTNGHLAPVSTEPSTNPTTEVRWYHEILYLATNSAFDDNYMPDGNWYHYGLLSTVGNNYHYSVDISIDTPHQLFPVLSIKDKSNVAYSVVSKGGTTWRTSARGCHGTSGSGVFQGGSDSFLGVIVTAGNGWASRLCDDLTKPAGTAANGEGMNFIRPNFTRALYNQIANPP